MNMEKDYHVLLDMYQYDFTSENQYYQMCLTIMSPKNSSSIYYPVNQISHFFTHLPKEFAFDTK